MYELSLNDKGMTFKELEKRIYKYACDEACNALKSILEFLDEKLLNERDSKVYRNKGRKQTCLRTIMGNVEYSRRIYEFKLEDGKKATKYLLDEYLGMSTLGNVSINLVETILTNVTEVSFRKTSENIKTMCNQDISAQGVWNIVQTLGEKIKSDVIDTVVAKLPLTVFQANKESNKCKVYKCNSAQIPYSGATATLGRKIVRDLCGLKSFSDKRA